jgi:hypothetical protein
MLHPGHVRWRQPTVITAVLAFKAPARHAEDGGERYRPRGRDGRRDQGPAEASRIAVLLIRETERLSDERTSGTGSADRLVLGWLPAPAVVVLACDRFTVPSDATHAVVTVAAILARLIAVT